MIAAPILLGRAEDATDRALVEAVRRGDDGAFEELFRRHQPEITRYVRLRVRDHGRAEDLTQDAFLSALRRLRQTEADIAFRPWIFEIARNATIDSYRRSSRAEEVSLDAPSMPPADADRLPGGAQPDLSIVEQERFRSLNEAMHELSDTHRRAIVLRELEGRSYREIGASLDLSQAAVESTLFRARRKLEYEYGELDSGRRCRLVGAAIGRLAEGLESDRDRLRLDRHARRCSACRRTARKLGVEPVLRKRSLVARAAAFLPLPVFCRRRLATDAAAAGEAGHGTGAALAPAVEMVSGVGGKAVALLVTAVFVGGGGATLGGVGPLAPGGATPPGAGQPSERPVAPASPAKESSSAAPATRAPAARKAEAAQKRAGAALAPATRPPGSPNGEGRPLNRDPEARTPSRPEPSAPPVPPAAPSGPAAAAAPVAPAVPPVAAPPDAGAPAAPQADTLPSKPPAAPQAVPPAEVAPVGAAVSTAMAQTQAF